MERFEISSAEHEGVAILYLKGYLDTHTAPCFGNAIRELRNAGKYSVIINFEELDYIGSAGLGVLMEFIEDLRKNGGDIKLCQMSPKIYRIFDLLGFPALFDILDYDAKALEKFRKRRPERWPCRLLDLKTRFKSSDEFMTTNSAELLGGKTVPTGVYLRRSWESWRMTTSILTPVTSSWKRVRLL